MGQEYDWHFSIAESSRDKNATGNRDNIIRKMVRDNLKNGYPVIYSAIKNAFKTQLRNSIAHSKYSLHGRYIHLNNYIKEDPASQMQVMSFDEWVDVIHDTIVLYTQISRVLILIDKLYETISSQFEQTMEIRINRVDPITSTEFHILKRRNGFNAWYWRANDE